jgi:hypothetical protein
MESHGKGLHDLDLMSMKSLTNSAFAGINYKVNNGSISQSGITSLGYSEGNTNFCPKHKKKLINYCLSDGAYLCAVCFNDHRNHKIEMLENYAQAVLTQLQKVVSSLDI